MFESNEHISDYENLMSILKVLELQELHDLVLADAAEVQGRQETDTVTIVDELRYHISSVVQSTSEIYEARTKLESLEALLEDLGIEA